MRSGSSSRVLLVALFALTCGVAAARGDGSKAAQTLKGLESVPLHASETGVVTMLGEPSQKISTDESMSWTNWLYNDVPSHRTRITLTFDKKNRDLLAKTFEVWEGDPESQIDTLKAKYKNLKKRELAWTNPHIAPDEVYYEDELKGISIEVRKTRREVVAITWYDPKTRSVAVATPKECVKFQRSDGLISCLPQQ